MSVCALRLRSDEGDDVGGTPQYGSLITYSFWCKRTRRKKRRRRGKGLSRLINALWVCCKCCPVGRGLEIPESNPPLRYSKYQGAAVFCHREDSGGVSE